jgi:hypothetical protein
MDKYGCWPAGISLGQDFYLSCVAHDLDYEKWDKTRREADKDFLVNMISESTKRRHPIKAIFYYTLVSLFWYVFYAKKQKS